MSGYLPGSWAVTQLNEICLPVEKSGPSNEKDLFRYIDLGAIDNHIKKIVQADSIEVSKAPSRAKQIVQFGDVVFSNVRVYLENIALVPEELDGEIASTAFCVIRPGNGIDPRYLYFFVTSRGFIQRVTELQRGNSPPSVQDGDVRTQTIALAPEKEQKRIASKIDELFSQIDEGEQALERVEKLLERYRQSVLKAAVTGELSREWREKQTGELETGEQLLERILKARREAWEKAELEKMAEKGKTPKDDGWKKKYKEPLSPDTTGLPELPKGWVWARAEQVCGFITKGTTPKSSEMTAGVGEVPFIKVYNLTFGGSIDFTIDPTFIDERVHKKKLSRSYVLPGDVLMNIVGPPLGKVSIVPDTFPEWNMNQAVAVFRPFDGLRRYFLMYFLLSRTAQDSYKSKAKATAGQFNLTLEICRDILIPVPPDEEQDEILSIINEELSKLVAVIVIIQQEKARSQRLRQAVLFSAFSGQLVPQDPSDEPASELLKRIADERAKAEAQAKARKKKATRKKVMKKKVVKKKATNNERKESAV